MKLRSKQQCRVRAAARMRRLWRRADKKELTVWGYLAQVMMRDNNIHWGEQQDGNQITGR